MTARRALVPPQWGVYVLRWGGRVLYVGKGHNGAHDRLADHRTKPWGPLITSREWIPAHPNTETAAFELERQLIANRAPLANIVHQAGRGRQFAAIVEHAHNHPTPPPRPARARYAAVWATIAALLFLAAVGFLFAAPLAITLTGLVALTACGLVMVWAEHVTGR